MASPSGQLLAGRYRTIKRLGSGGMATVLLADDERLGREVAIKRMHAESPEEAATRFRREAQLGAALNHPNIVSIYDIETDPENVLIVMEYVPGGTLKDALARGPLPREHAMKVLRGIAAALDYAHEHGVVHRDVKPANILLDAQGRAKLADLGIATAAEVTSITRTGAVMGTAAYMPPERLDGQRGDAAADVYALATVAYEVFTGRKARQGRSAVEVAAMVMSEPPPDLLVHAPDAPEAAARVLERGMARDPADRPASAGGLIDQLGAAFDAAEDPGAPEATEPVPRPGYVRHRAAGGAPGGRADRRWVLPVAGLAVALLAVVIALVLTSGDDSGGSGPGGSSSRSSSSGDASRDSSTRNQAPPGGASGGSDGDTGSAGGAGGGSAADAPAQTVRDFYTLAADDEFEQSWDLVGPDARQQLGGYDSFVGTLKTLEKIEFPELKTTLSSRDNATVDFESVATHSDHVDRCTGTVDLTGSGDSWKIEQIHPTCNQGGSRPEQPNPGKGPDGGRMVPPGN